MHRLSVPHSVTRGELAADQIVLLDEALAHHGLPKTSPHQIPERLAYACLMCGSIGEAPTQESRDALVDNFDFTCCGLTVIFHSNQRTLIDPSQFTVVQQVTPENTEPCIHEGLFPRDRADGSFHLTDTQVCQHCNQAIPNREL